MRHSREHGVEKAMKLLGFTRSPLWLRTMFRLVLISVYMWLFISQVKQPGSKIRYSLSSRLTIHKINSFNLSSSHWLSISACLILLVYKHKWVKSPSFMSQVPIGGSRQLRISPHDQTPRTTVTLHLQCPRIHHILASCTSAVVLDDFFLDPCNSSWVPSSLNSQSSWKCTWSQGWRLLSHSDILKSTFTVYQKAQVFQVKCTQGHDLNSSKVLTVF